MNKSVRKAVRVSTAIAQALAWVAPAAVPTALLAAEPVAVLDEVRVTARRREENLQSVPTSVVAFSSEQIALAGFSEVKDLDAMVPNLSIQSHPVTGPNNADVRVRGVPGVGIFVDGIWQPSGANLLDHQFIEIERVEVLRGPQGTLYGQNTLGGAINIITAKPTADFGGAVDATLGNYSRHDVVAWVNVPISTSFQARFTGALLKRNGFINQVNGKNDYGDVDRKNFRGDFLWTPTDNFDARLTLESDKFDQNGSALVLSGFGPGGLIPAYNNLGARFGLQPITAATHVSGFPGGQVGKSAIKSNRNGDAWTQDARLLTATLNWKVNDWLKVKSLTGYRKIETFTVNDLDGTDAYIFDNNQFFRSNEVSQELQLLGSNNRWDWVVGAYGWRQKTDQRMITWIQGDLKRVGFPFPVPNQNDINRLEDEGRALFGELNFDVTSRLKTTLGLRRSRESLTDIQATPVTAVPALGVRLATDPFAGTNFSTLPGKFNATTGKFSAQFQWTEKFMTYASYSQGFGPGSVKYIRGVGLPAAQEFVKSVDPERVSNIEIGFRSDFLEKRLRLNVTAFAMKWKDIVINEANLPDPANPGSFLAIFVPTNVGEAKINGAEIELNYRPNAAWTFMFNGGWLDSKYTKVGRATTIALNSQLAESPKSSFGVSVQHDATFANGGSLINRLNYGWTDDYSTNTDRTVSLTQKSYGLLSYRLQYTPPSNKWQLSLYGDNLTNEFYFLNSLYVVTGANLSYVGRPREVGATFKLKF